MAGLNTGGWGTTRIKAVAACHPGEQHYANGLCKACYRSTPKHKAQRHGYYLRRLERYREYTQESKERRVRQVKAYGVDRETIDAMLEQQGGVCAICQCAPLIKALSVDHNHTTGAVRGLLCSSCNRALGMFRDRPDLLRAAIDYLHERDNSIRAKAITEGSASADGWAPVRRAGVSSPVRQDSAGREPPHQGLAGL